MTLKNSLRRKTLYNRIYKKLAVQFLNKALGFVSNFVLLDSFTLGNRQFLVAYSCYESFYKKTRR